MKSGSGHKPSEISEIDRQRHYWDSNLDPENLGRKKKRAMKDLNRDLEFYFSPEQKYALKKMWGTYGIRGKRILEIGSGMGVFALFLAKQEAEVYVIDISIERLQRLRREANRHGVSEHIHIICGEAERLPFCSEFFDIVYTKSVLIHTKLKEAAYEASRILKPGGSGIFVEPMTGNPFARFYRRFLGPEEWKSITKYFDRKRLKTLCSPFSRAVVRYFYLFGFLAFIFQFGVRNLTLFKAGLRILGAIDKFLFTIIPAFKKLSWFAVVSVSKENKTGEYYGQD